MFALRRPVPLRALPALAVLPVLVLLPVGPAAAAGPGLLVGGVPLSGATVANDAAVDLVSPGAASVSWVLDGEYLGRDTSAPFVLELATDDGEHKLKARAETRAGVQTTYQVRFLTAGDAPAAGVGTPAPAAGGAAAAGARPSAPGSTPLGESVASAAGKVLAALRRADPAAPGSPVVPGRPAVPVPPAVPGPPAVPSLPAGPPARPGGPVVTPGAGGPADGSVRGVQTAAQLVRALEEARPGQVIELADGRYAGPFVISASGTATKPIVLRGGIGAVLDGGVTAKGYALHLQDADFWRLEGFTVRGAQKGVVLDGSDSNVLSRLDIGSTGMEGVHFRTSSSDNRLEDSAVHDTGLVDRGYGEGVYIGSATSNWRKYGQDGGPDRSDRNVLTGNHVYATTAENLDIKEGTTGGVVAGNVFDGRGMTGDHFADSWVDVKGNGYRIEGNVGRHALVDGFQTHVQLDGWGRDNVFRGNQLTVGAGGYGINVHRADTSTGNVVGCDNVVIGAGRGSANLRCR